MTNNKTRHLNSIRLTPFQKKVLMVVSTIPKGQVRSYKWVAEKIGRPGAFRAVGQALNRNPIPVIVPCHRVIKSDLKLGGFSRGAKVKKELLLSEGLTVRKGTVIINQKKGNNAGRY